VVHASTHQIVHDVVVVEDSCKCLISSHCLASILIVFEQSPLCFKSGAQLLA
jgi:hypothetical protein